MAGRFCVICGSALEFARVRSPVGPSRSVQCACVDAPGLFAVSARAANGAVQAGTYNSRALVPEVLVRADEWALVRPRVTAAELIALDRLPGWL